MSTAAEVVVEAETLHPSGTGIGPRAPGMSTAAEEVVEEEGETEAERYKLADFPGIGDLVYCKRMVELVEFDCMEDEAPPDETPAEALVRRLPAARWAASGRADGRAAASRVELAARAAARHRRRRRRLAPSQPGDDDG